MSETGTSYVVQTPEGGLRIVGSRVTLDSIVHAYWDGSSPEAIREEYPTLSLEQVYGAVAYYLGHRAQNDLFMQDLADKWEEFRRESEATNHTLLTRLRESRQKATRKDG